MYVVAPQILRGFYGEAAGDDRVDRWVTIVAGPPRSIREAVRIYRSNE
jgi:hypothetical protein